MSDKNLLVKKANISKFDDFSTYAWIHSGSYNFFERSLVRRVLKNHLPRGRFAIDVGCGPGLVLKEMYHIYDYCVGTDISPGILRQAKTYLEAKEKCSIDLLCADIEHMPFKNSAFEIASMYSVLHHLPNLNSSLKEMNRIMNTKSPLILFHEPNEMHMRRVFEKTLLRILGKTRTILLKSVHKGKWQRFKQETQRRFTNMGELENLADIYARKGFGITEMKRLLEESGFKIVQIKTRIQSFMITFSQLRWPYKLIAALDFVLSEVPILNTHLPLLFCIARKKEV
jgi:ubiquinone/menaquinone biosynthesis C-methylase UbiE